MSALPLKKKKGFWKKLGSTLTPDSIKKRRRRKRRQREAEKSFKVKQKSLFASSPKKKQSRSFFSENSDESFDDSQFFSAEEFEDESLSDGLAYSVNPPEEIPFESNPCTIEEYTDIQKELIDEILEKCRIAELDLSKWAAVSGESEVHLVVRFLVSRRWSVSKAFDMLKNDIVWRKEQNVCNFTSLSTLELSGVTDEKVRQFMPAWQQGFDKAGRPVMYKRFGRAEIDTLCGLGATVEGLGKWHISQNEKLCSILKTQTEKLERPVQKFCFVIDAKGWSIRIWTKKAIRFVRRMADIDSDHYPERLGILYCVNCPRLLTIAWAMISRWLDDRQRSKIHMFCYEKDWIPLLQEEIGVDQLSELFGGNLSSPVNVMTKEEREKFHGTMSDKESSDLTEQNISLESVATFNRDKDSDVHRVVVDDSGSFEEKGR